MFEKGAGQPPKMVRPVDPPARVWINVRPVLAASSHHIYRHVPGGLRTRYEVPGVLHEWALGEDGAWLGQVTYKLVSSDSEWSIEVTHYVPGHLIKPRDLTRRHRLR